jgi:hypothetical protein
MTNAALQAELAESKAEILRLRESLQAVIPVVHKDSSLISLVPKWTGTESAIPLDEFLASIDGAARIGHWSSADQLQIAVLKLQDPAKSIYNTCLELHEEGTTWERFKCVP